MSVQMMSKTVVSVAEMARMVSLSRARFYQLAKEGIFPTPIYDVATRRPFFNEELQSVCLEVRRKNCGVNGKPILFYSTRYPLSQVTKTGKSTKSESKSSNQYGDLLNNLRALGLEAVTTGQISAVMNELFPRGTADLDSGEVIRAAFLRLKRRDS